MSALSVEAGGMASDEINGTTDDTNPLLSLTGKGDDILLSYVSAGEGGAQAVLNLRKVCSTTKKWVDTLRPLQAKRIFSSRQAKVELSAELLEEFVAAPPPNGVTTLCLTQTDILEDVRFPAEKEEFWSDFVSFWMTANLESLEIDVLRIPFSVKLGQLISCPSLRFLRCRTIQSDAIPSAPIEFSPCLFRFEKLSVERFEFEVSKKREFFSRLSSQQNLQQLSLKIEKIEELAEITNLIEKKRDDDNFQLCLEIAPRTLRTTFSFVPDYGRFLEDLYVRFAISVGNSSSSVRIRGLTQKELKWTIYLRVENEICLKFLKSVVGMEYYFLELPHFGNCFGPTVADFPNLETYIMKFRGDASESQDLRMLDATTFPPNLKKLQLKKGFPRPASLPPTLTHLEIQDYSCSTNELLRGLFSLAENSPCLKNLKLNCKFTGAKRNASYDFQSSRFKDLKSLDFSAEITNESEAAVVRMILLHGFKLPQLNLRYLKLSLDAPFCVVDHNLLIALNSGPISNSLWNVDIENRYVVEDAHPFLDHLKSTAAENKCKRVETHGKEREKQFDR